MKKLISILLIFSMIFSSFAFAFADDTSIKSGSCGTTSSYTLYGNGDLYISGSGAMASYSDSSKYPWDSYRSSITNIIISEGITSIGNYAFSNCTKLENVDFPSTLDSIGKYAFAMDSKLSCIIKCVNYIDESAFYYCNNGDITIIYKGNSIAKGALAACKSLQFFIFDSNITEISQMCFQGCNNLIGLYIPYSVNVVNDYSTQSLPIQSVYYQGSQNDWALIWRGSHLGLDGKAGIENYNSTFVMSDAYEINFNASTIHDYYTVEGWPATCEEDGYTDYDYCPNCQQIISGHEIISALGHDLQTVAATAATCVKDGNIQYYVCDRCEECFSDIDGQNKINDSDYIIPATGHNLIETQAIIVNSNEHIVCYHCGICNDYYSDVLGTKEIDKNTIAEIIDSGTCGEHTTWTFDSKGRLTISGYGSISYYGSGNSTPWTSYKNQIVSVIVDEGITEIPAYTFEYLYVVERIDLPRNLTFLALNAFNYCHKLKELVFPYSLTEFLADRGFNNCESLDTILFLGTSKEFSSIKNSNEVIDICRNGWNNANFNVIFLEYHEGTVSCDVAGYLPYYSQIINSATNYFDENRSKIDGIQYVDAFGHNYGEAVFSWSADGKSATAVRTCSHDSNHKLEGNAVVTSAVKTSATCESKGTTTYTAKITLGGTEYTSTKDVEDIPVLGHEYGEAVFSWSADGKSATATRTCSHDSNHKLTGDATITSAVKTPATCETEGTTTYTAKITLGGTEYTATKDVVDISALGHDCGEAVFSWSEDGKSASATRTCSHDASHKLSGDAVITPAVKTPATCTEKGTTTYTAKITLGGTEYTSTKDVVDIAALGHTPKEAVVENSVDSTCEEDGSYDSVVYCDICGNELSRETKSISKLGHDYGEAVFSWSADGKSASATRTCSHDANHKLTGDAVVTSEVKTPATCEAKGTTTYTAKITLGGTEYTDTKDVVDILALGHDYGDSSYEWTATESGYKCTATRICSHDANHVETETVQGAYSLVTSATCTAKGQEKYTVNFANSAFNTQVKFVDIASLGHDLVHHEAKDPTCEEKGWDAYDTCSRCDYTTYVEKSALGHDYAEASYVWTSTEGGYKCTATRICKHDANHIETEEVQGIYTLVNAATCTAKGQEKYVADFQNNAFNSQIKYVDISALGHDLVHHEAKDPTCEEKGWDAYDTCSRCDYTTYVEKSILGHDYGDAVFSWSEDGTIATAARVCSHDANHKMTGDAVVTSVVKTPATYTEKGTTTYTAKITLGDTEYTDTKDVIDINILFRPYLLTVDGLEYSIIINEDISNVNLVIAYYSDDGKMLSVVSENLVVEIGSTYTGRLERGNCKILVLDSSFIPLFDSWSGTID